MKLFKDRIKLTTMCVVLSIFTLVAYHFPFFRLVIENTEGGLNGTLIFAGLAVLVGGYLALHRLVMKPAAPASSDESRVAEFALNRPKGVWAVFSSLA